MTNYTTKKLQFRPSEIVPDALDHAIRTKVKYDAIKEEMSTEAIANAFGVSPAAINERVLKYKKEFAQSKGGKHDR